MKKNEYVLYGLSKHKEIIDKIINDLKVIHDHFDIRLILTEALTNAFKHGNSGNVDKSIQLRYTFDDSKIIFEVEDSGTGFKNITIPDEALEENLLNESGRGLFLIKCIADKLELRNNTLIIEKYLTE